MDERLYIIYDQRAYTEDPTDCVVMCTASSIWEARQDRNDMFPGCPIYSYDNSDKVLKDLRFEE